MDARGGVLFLCFKSGCGWFMAVLIDVLCDLRRVWLDCLNEQDLLCGTTNFSVFTLKRGCQVGV